jgi:hypothetical protein
MPQSANRYKVSVQKVPSKMYQETSGNSKKASRKIGSGAISNDSIREGCGDELDTTTVMEGSSDSSSTSADSGGNLNESVTWNRITFTLCYALIYSLGFLTSLPFGCLSIYASWGWLPLLQSKLVKNCCLF